MGNITVNEAIKKATTEFIVVTKNGKIININGKICGRYNQNQNIKSVDIINNVCDGRPVITAIRI